MYTEADICLQFSPIEPGVQKLHKIKTATVLLIYATP